MGSSGHDAPVWCTSNGLTKAQANRLRRKLATHHHGLRLGISMCRPPGMFENALQYVRPSADHVTPTHSPRCDLSEMDSHMASTASYTLDVSGLVSELQALLAQVSGDSQEVFCPVCSSCIPDHSLTKSKCPEMSMRDFLSVVTDIKRRLPACIHSSQPFHTQAHDPSLAIVRWQSVKELKVTAAKELYSTLYPMHLSGELISIVEASRANNDWRSHVDWSGCPTLKRLLQYDTQAFGGTVATWLNGEVKSILQQFNECDV